MCQDIVKKILFLGLKIQIKLQNKIYYSIIIYFYIQCSEKLKNKFMNYILDSTSLS